MEQAEQKSRLGQVGRPVPTTLTFRCKQCGRRYRIRWTTPNDGLCGRHTTGRR